MRLAAEIGTKFALNLAIIFGQGTLRGLPWFWIWLVLNPMVTGAPDGFSPEFWYKIQVII
jgi:hypothetical protein